MTGQDVVVVGSGPNGLTAAARMARAGRDVVVLEAAAEAGGGTRSASLTEPGFIHDACSAIHPFSIVSPAYRALGVDIKWIVPPIAVSHPLDGGRSATLHNNIDETSAALGPADGAAWRKIVKPIVDELDAVVDTFLGSRIIPNPLSPAERSMALIGARPATALAARFETGEARALIAGLAAHSVAPLDTYFTSGVALLFGAIANSRGWPLVHGGSSGIAEALMASIEDDGGEIRTGATVTDLTEFEGSTVFLDTSPLAARELARSGMGPAEIMRMGRWKPGPGVFKIDYALDGPIPWSDDSSLHAGTVHVGGTFEEIAAAEAAVSRGEHPESPFVLVAQQSDFDHSRAPEGKRTGWAYCHVPNGSDVDMTDAIESQIERFAPGFRDTVLARHVRNAPDFEAYNPNYIGGDISGGAFSVGRFLPRARSPYRLSPKVFLCSAATPPGGGTHGMCGWNAAGEALR